MKHIRIVVAVGMACAVSTLIAVAHAQGGAAAPSAIDALLLEVRGLRAEINQSASASIRAQLLTARLQLEEQRIYTVARQAADVQNLLASVRQEIAGLQTKIKSFEEVTTGTPRGEQDRAAFEDIRKQIPYERASLEQKQRREQELRTQETDLLNALITEQGRWNDFNGRLDDIERSLTQASR